MPNLSGFSLVEVLIALAFVGLTVHVAVPPIRHQADVYAVRLSREEIVGLFARARAHARERGRATVEVREGTDPVLLSHGGREIGRAPVSGRGVRVELLGRRTEASLVYGPLGTAGFASTSLVLRRGSAESHLVVSSYGRVRR